MRRATKAEQIEVVQDAICVAITQSAELSGLRNWLIYNALKKVKPGEFPNGEMIVHGYGRQLTQAFQDIIDPDDTEYFESSFYLQCDTEKGIFRLADLVYESEPI